MQEVSVIIPMYNEEKYIGRCLDSLLEQTFQSFEVILIDDGSTDKSIEISSLYKNRLPLTLLEQQHGGPGRARNRGAREAKGEILVFVDADMAFDKNYLAELIEPVRSGSELGTTHGWEYVANKNNVIARAYGNIRLAYNPEQPKGGVFRAIKKDVFLAHSGYDDTRYAFEDDMSDKIGEALYVPTAICYHNNPESFIEIFNHEVRIGESLIAKKKAHEYLMKYKLYIALFILMCLCAVIVSFQLHIGRTTFLLIVIGGLLVLILYVAIRRAIRERYLSHLVYVPLVIITRGLGYFRGMVRYSIFPKT